jgi:hypothetical protein
MRLAAVRLLVLASCLLAVCSCAKRDSEEVAKLKKELEAAKAELARSKPPEQNASDNKKSVRPRPDGKVYRTASDLLADMPKEAYPKSGEMGGVQRSRARKWCGENLVGRTVEWTGTVTKVKDYGDGPFKVEVETDAAATLVPAGGALYLRKVIPFDRANSRGEQSCQVYVRIGVLPDDVTRITYTCTADEVARLQKLKDKKVTFRSTVEEVVVSDSPVSGFDHVVPIVLLVTMPAAIDGFLPKANRPKDEK